MENIDIKALARQLKKEGNQYQEIVGNQTPPAKTAPAKKSNKRTFSKLIDELNHRKDFNCIGGVYIDEDLHELLSEKIVCQGSCDFTFGFKNIRSFI